MPADPLVLGHFPTPLREMANLRRHLGARPRLWIKHDDWAGPGFGGNKVRKLEYVLAEALGHGCDTVLTTGGVRSNHCRVTAACAAALGLECHLVINGDPPSSQPASYFLDQMYGARMHHVAARDDRQPALEALSRELEAAGRKPFVIPLGASTPLGALGFVRGAGELLHQTREMGFEPDWIVHATSSGGTQAGMLGGLMRHGARTRVLGVSADDSAAEIAGVVGQILKGLPDLLGEPLPEAEILVDDTRVGAGYGAATVESDAASRLLARAEGVILESFYTAKAMAGLLAAVETGRFDTAAHVIFWHTGGQLALFSAP